MSRKKQTNSKAELPLDDNTEKPKWSFKYLRFLTNPRFNESAWIVNVAEYLPLESDIVEAIQGYSCHAIRIKGHYGAYDSLDVHSGVGLNKILEDVFNTDGRKGFNMYSDDRLSKIGFSEYYTLSEFARYHKLRINKKKMVVENVRGKRK